MNRPNLASALVIPDSLLAKEATDILRKYSTDLLFNHSIRVYLFAAEQGGQQKLRFDPELLYVAAVFHDDGLLVVALHVRQRFGEDAGDIVGRNGHREFPGMRGWCRGSNVAAPFSEPPARAKEGARLCTQVAAI